MLKRLLSAVLLIAGTCLSSVAQTIKYKSVSNQDLTYVLNNMQKRYVYTDHKTLNIAVYLVADQQGVTNAPADCKTASSIYVAVAEIKPQPEQYVYKLNSVCDPKFINWIKSKNMYKIAFSYGSGTKKENCYRWDYAEETVDGIIFLVVQKEPLVQGQDECVGIACEVNKFGIP